MNELDYKIIDFLLNAMHKYLPFTNICVMTFPVGEYMFYLIVFYVIAEMWLIKQPGKKGGRN